MIFLFFMETSRDSDFWHCGSNADVPVVVEKKNFTLFVKSATTN